MKNINDAREEVTKFLKDYSAMRNIARYDTTREKRLEIFTAKQLLQRLPISFARENVGNTSENLLNEIRQIIYYLYQAKEIAKKSITI